MMYPTDTSQLSEHVTMDRAYEDNKTQQLVLDFGMTQPCRPNRNRFRP